MKITLNVNVKPWLTPNFVVAGDDGGEGMDVLWEHRRCLAYCECAVCVMAERVGEHGVRVFESLRKKAPRL